MLHIVLADDHNIVRYGIKKLLETEEGLNVIGEATDGEKVLDIVNKLDNIDLVLTEINMPLMDGITLIRELKLIKPNIQVIILSMLREEKYIYQAFAAGASGYLLKNVGLQELVFALKHVSLGNKYLCSDLSINFVERLICSSASPASLFEKNIEFSAREIEVLNLISQGLTNLEMSEKLFLSKRTIEGHRQSLIEKTGSRNTAALIRFAVQSGILK